MLILDLTTGQFSDPEAEDSDQRDSYPDQVLNSEWNPVLTEIQSIHIHNQEPSKLPAHPIIEAALARLYIDE